MTVPGGSWLPTAGHSLWPNRNAGARWGLVGKEGAANGNSHVFPQYQVLDDNNNFRGYVQVEAPFHNPSSSACSSSDERSCDMLRIGHYSE